MNSFLMRWPEADPAALKWFREIAVTHLWLPWDAPGNTQAFLQACRAASIAVIAEFPPDGRAQLALARKAGFDGAAFTAEGDEKALAALVNQHSDWQLFALLDPARIHWRTGAARAVLAAGLWPGARRLDPAAAGATQQAWLDANAYLIACLRGLFAGRDAWLGYRADERAGVSKTQPPPYGSVEVALAEAVMAGGGLVLTLPEHYRQALLRGKETAHAAWRSLLQTARFLREHRSGFLRPFGARVAVVAGSLPDCAEIVNLLYRHNVSPAVAPTNAIPAYGRFRILVAVGLGPHPAAARAVLTFARAGGKVLAVPVGPDEPAWWRQAAPTRIRSEENRDFFALGQGLLIAYREPVEDPGELALDVIDAMGWRTRDLRIWGSTTVLGILHRLDGGRLSVELLSYGGPARDFLLRVEGRFQRATLRRPGAPALPLRAAMRGTGTEVEISRLERVASLLLE